MLLSACCNGATQITKPLECCETLVSVVCPQLFKALRSVVKHAGCKVFNLGLLETVCCLHPTLIQFDCDDRVVGFEELVITQEFEFFTF